MTLGDRIVVLKDGRIHQSGPPLEVFQKPANRFVAGFVGTPPMNFLNGTLVGQNGAVYFDEGTAQVRLTDDQSRELADWVGKEVILGVRPETMAITPEGRFAGEDNSLPIKVKVVEPLGEKMDLYAETDKHAHIVARVDADSTLTAGQTVQVYLDIDRVHVFDPAEDGANLTAAALQTA